MKAESILEHRTTGAVRGAHASGVWFSASRRKHRSTNFFVSGFSKIWVNESSGATPELARRRRALPDPFADSGSRAKHHLFICLITSALALSVLPRAAAETNATAHADGTSSTGSSSPSGKAEKKSTAKSGASTAATAAPETTPLSLPGSEPFVFRKVGETELRLHVVKPAGWTKTEQRPCLVSFFGGGWNSGTPERSIAWAKWAAGQGLVGIAPDYRTRNRFGTAPEDCVADGRAAVTWIKAHAPELGIDPKKIIALGSSAGGHVAAWSAIPTPGPGKDDPAPPTSPAALVLVNPVTDTKEGGYGGPKRFGKDPARALACSVPDRMPAKMPPAIVFHATADKTVPYSNSVAFKDKLVSNGNRCELVTFEGLGHSYSSSQYGEAGKAADQKTREAVAAFLTSLGLMENLKPAQSQ